MGWMSWFWIGRVRIELTLDELMEDLTWGRQD